MKIGNDAKYKVFGDLSYREKCISEDAVHVGFVAWVRYNYPEIGLLLIHPKNEGKKTHQQITLDKKMGSIVNGASDIIIPGSPSFVCELKKADHTKSHWQPNQEEYLNTAATYGAFACVAFGLDAAKDAFLCWLKTVNHITDQSS